MYNDTEVNASSWLIHVLRCSPSPPPTCTAIAGHLLRGFTWLPCTICVGNAGFFICQHPVITSQPHRCFGCRAIRLERYLYFSFENGTLPASSCARRLRSESSLALNAAQVRWVLSDATCCPCYHFCPNHSQPTASEALCFGTTHRITDNSNLLNSSVDQHFPIFHDGVW
jgi:hypothetical protein